MATVIDSLIVELGLDPKGFTQGQKEAGASFLKTKQEASKTAKDMEDSGKKAAQFFSQLRGNVIALFAAFTAGKGLKEFIADVVTADALVGRFSVTLDTNIGTLSAWNNIASLSGGTAQGMTGSIAGLVSQFQTFSITGESSVIPYFRALGINISDSSGRMRNMQDILLDLSDKFSHLDPARAAAFGHALGFDEATINLLIRGRSAIQAMLDEQKRLGVITKADAEAGIALQHSWGALGQSSTSLGRTLLTELAPFLIKVLDGLTGLAVWARSHGPFLEAVFTGLAIAAGALAIALLVPYGTIILITAAVAGLIAAGALLYDDWKTWTQGGKTVFGDFFSGVAQQFKALVSVFVDGWKIIRDVFTGNFSALKGDWANLFRDLGQEVLGAVKTVTGGASGIKTIATGLYRKAVGAASGGSSPSASAPAPAPVSKSASSAEAWKAAQESEKKYGIPAGVTYAQWALESGYGKHTPAGSNNPFGIKARAGQPFVSALTTEVINGQTVRVRQNFAKFNSLADAFDAHAKLLATSRYYAGARAHKNDAGAFADALTGVYATDPNYGAKLRAIMNSAAVQVAIANASRQAPKSSGTSLAGARLASTSTTHSKSSTVSSQTHVGKIEIHTAATDANGIAKTIKPAVDRYGFASQANYGAA